MGKYCGNCGNEIGDKALFCGKCGKPTGHSPTEGALQKDNTRPMEEAYGLPNQEDSTPTIQNQSDTTQTLQGDAPALQGTYKPPSQKDNTPASQGIYRPSNQGENASILQGAYKPPNQENNASTLQGTYRPSFRENNAQSPQQSYSQPPYEPYTAPNAQPAKIRRHWSGSDTLCIVLSLVLLLQMIIVALYGWPGFALKNKANKESSSQAGIISQDEGATGLSNIKLKSRDYKAKPTIIDVGPENTIAKSDGIVVDFGEFNLMEDEELQIKDLGVKKDNNNGLSAHCYDFHMEDTTDFPTLVSITLPYEEREYAKDRLFVQYYREDSNTWELLYSELDEAHKTITFYTDHFSTFALFDFFNFKKNDNSDPLAEVVFNSSKLEEALNSNPANPDLFFQILKKGSTEDSELINLALDSLDISGDLVSASDNTVKLISSSGFLSETVSKALGKSLGRIGGGIVAIKVGLSWHKSGSITDALKAHKYDLAELGLSMAAPSLGLIPLTIAAAGIWALGMADKKVTSIFNKGYEGPIEHAYQLFTFEYVSYSKYSGSFGCTLPNDMPARAYFDDMKDAKILNNGNAWGELLKREFFKYRDDPEKIFKSFEKLVDDYASVFWRLKPEIRKFIAEDIHRADPWQEPSNSEMVKQKEKVKAITHKRLEKLYAFIYERCILDSKQRLLWEMKDLQDEMNKISQFNVYALDGKGNEIPFSKTEYKDYIAAFAQSPNDKPTIWTWMPGGKDKKEFKCTLYNYLAIGSPTCVKFYKSKEDQTSDNAAFSISFTYGQPNVDLILNMEDEPDDGDSDTAIVKELKDLYEGRWGDGDPNNTFEIEILNATTAKFTYTHTDPLICDLYYSGDDLTSIDVHVSVLTLGEFTIDRQAGILTQKPDEIHSYSYTRE